MEKMAEKKIKELNIVVRSNQGEALSYMVAKSIIDTFKGTEEQVVRRMEEAMAKHEVQSFKKDTWGGHPSDEVKKEPPGTAAGPQRLQSKPGGSAGCSLFSRFILFRFLFSLLFCLLLFLCCCFCSFSISSCSSSSSSSSSFLFLFCFLFWFLFI